MIIQKISHLIQEHFFVKASGSGNNIIETKSVAGRGFAVPFRNLGISLNQIGADQDRRGWKAFIYG